MTIYEAAKKMVNAIGQRYIIQYKYYDSESFKEGCSIAFSYARNGLNITTDNSDYTITTCSDKSIFIIQSNTTRRVKILNEKETAKMWEIVKEDKQKQHQNNMKIIRETMGNVGISILKSVENSSDDQLIKDLIYSAGTLADIINNDLKK